MRLVAHTPAVPGRRSAKRIIIATNPQSVASYPAGWVVMFGGYSAEGEDGPAMMVVATPTVDDAMAELEEVNPGCHREWREYPDQVPGCQDDWLGPVRVYRDE